MRLSPFIGVSLCLALVAPLARAEDEKPKVFTNQDLAADGAKKDAGQAAASKVVTNADLKTEGGNLTFSDAANVPQEPPARESASEAKTTDSSIAREMKAQDLKQRYRKLTERKDELEEELPAAREAEKEETLHTQLVDWKGNVADPNDFPKHQRRLQIETELKAIAKEMAEIEAAASALGMHRPELVQR